MDFGFVSHHLISGCIPMFAVLLLYFAVLQLAGKKQTAGHIIASLIFSVYLVGILTVTGICIRGSFSPTIVCIPFVDMIKGPTDTILNIILFMPMGIFLPILYKNYDGIGKIALAAFLISLSIEIVQMFGFGKTDINDLITNTAGACLSYGIYRGLCKGIPESVVKQIQIYGVQCSYELPFFWISSLLIMLTVQVRIFHAFFR